VCGVCGVCGVCVVCVLGVGVGGVGVLWVVGGCGGWGGGGGVARDCVCDICQNNLKCVCCTWRNLPSEKCATTGGQNSGVVKTQINLFLSVLRLI